MCHTLNFYNFFYFLDIMITRSASNIFQQQQQKKRVLKKVMMKINYWQVVHQPKCNKIDIDPKDPNSNFACLRLTVMKDIGTRYGR
jgi:hypothetical protein